MTGVLVVAASGDPGRLLEAPVPTAGIYWPPRPIGEPGSVSLPPVYSAPWRPGAGQAKVLPLWWAGHLVEEAWDRARRAAGVHPTPAPFADAVVGFAQSLVRQGLASRVVVLP